jgi:predicted metal-binding membrane protein
MAAVMPTPLEDLLRRDRAVVLASLIGLTALAWFYLVDTALDMDVGAMDGSAGGVLAMAPMPWDATHFALMFLMWAIMMVGMMLPSAAPMILLFAAIDRRKRLSRSPFLRTAVFTLGYLLTWTAFSLAATALQWALNGAALLSPMLVSTSHVLGVTLFIAAGIYQLTPLKHACLQHCRSPVHFITAHWRPGTAGALRMGVEHGAYCVGCCWFLMGLLFVGGVMNLLWVAVIAAFVLIEKVVPRGELVAWASGVLMLTFASYLLLQLRPHM